MLLRVIRVSAKICIHQFLSLRADRVLALPLERDENRINLIEDLRVAVFEYPSPLSFVIGVKNAQATRLFLQTFLRAPNTILVPLREFGLVQVVGVKDQRFALGEENTA